MRSSRRSFPRTLNGRKRIFNIKTNDNFGLEAVSRWSRSQLEMSLADGLLDQAMKAKSGGHCPTSLSDAAFNVTLHRVAARIILFEYSTRGRPRVAKATEKKDGRGRPYEMPDPDDRSVNAPHVIVEGQAVVGYVRQTVDPKAKVVSQAVREGYETAAKSAGWADVTWVEDAAVLKANIIRK